MRFLIDECTGPKVAKWLSSQEYDVFSVFDEERGIDDVTVIEKALHENRILITNDKDFGEKIFREHFKHKGVILLRLKNESSDNKIYVIQKLLEKYSEQLNNQFVVVTEKQVRFARHCDVY